jgi:hypothetical protein
MRVNAKSTAVHDIRHCAFDLSISIPSSISETGVKFMQDEHVTDGVVAVVEPYLKRLLATHDGLEERRPAFQLMSFHPWSPDVGESTISFNAARIFGRIASMPYKQI